MFPWNIGKSAEAMFSRWALKRVCKFLLKKKLGQFILGEIDVDQLDVQLFSQGTVQLKDLALNVDFLNQKLGAAASVIIKEGSIGSLLVRMPWKGCEVEVDEVEIVLVPCADNNLPASAESCNSDKDGNPGKSDNDSAENAAKSTSRDVHEGVKTIAKIVKWFLTSFHVRIKRLIIAFDPCIEANGKTLGCGSTLVLRISEIECGTCVSEDDRQNADARYDNILGISQLTNFVKFQGAALELLHMEYVDNQTCIPCESERTFGESFSGCRLPGATTPILTGKSGGFSGNLKLSIPWKNGSLDIRKVDADASIEPIELRLKPSSIKWLLLAWEKYENLERNHHKSADSVYLDSASQCISPRSFCSPTDTVMQTEASSLILQESVTEGLLPGSHLISDWVPFLIPKNIKEGVEELDFGASVDQFFECFDGMRSSQSALGSSGMWNWTCSVFTAITAASSLASGSLHIPSEQQHVETNLKATLAGISVVFSFQDENQTHFQTKGVQSDAVYLGAECRDIRLVTQVCPQEIRFQGTMDYVEVASYSNYNNDSSAYGFQGCNNNINSCTASVQHLQADVQSALPQFSASFEDLDESNALTSEDFPLGCKDVVRTTLLKTSGVTHCHFTVSSSSSNGSLSGTTSFSLKLPHFVFWVDFCLLSMLFELSKELGKAVQRTNEEAEVPSEASSKNHRSGHRNLRRSSSCVTTLSSTESMRGDIFIPNARIILCFRIKGGEDIRGFSSWDQFIALQFSSPSTFKKGVIQDHSPALDASLQKRYSSTATRSLNLNVGNLDIFLVSSAREETAGISSLNMQRKKISVQNIISIADRKGRLSVISMVWQEGCVTGPWIAKKAKSLATFEESRSSSKFVGKDHEFASVSTVKDLQDSNSQTRQEIILSSAFFLHACLPSVSVTLGTHQYKMLCCLLDQMGNELNMACDSVNVKQESSISQTSILVGCDSVEILITLDVKGIVKASMQSELPGSWHQLKLKVQKLEVLSVSNIGGITGANFFWLAHGEGKLWGSITGIPDQEFLLIACSNSTLKRGDGGGSNALSSRLAGSDIVHLWDPQRLHNSTSLTVRCATIVAVGGRLDWVDALCSFFTIPSPETEQAVDWCNEKGDFSSPCGSSFVLNLVDVGLSYEPYLKVRSEASDSEPIFTYAREEMGEEHVGCLLAASSLNLSNSTTTDSMENEYRIRVQDLGLLLRVTSKPRDVGSIYSVEHLQKIGYVKVAREALVEANLRTNCNNGLLWEVECSKSHIYVETCHDTMSSLFRLAAQLQQLFAPDVEESVVHLQTRWNKVQHEQERNGFNDEPRTSGNNSVLPTSQLHTSDVVTESETGLVGLMDEICDDAFHLDKNQTCSHDSSEPQICISFDQDFGEACYSSTETPEIFSPAPSYEGPVLVAEWENSQTSFVEEGNVPELIEGYCLSELRPLSGLSADTHSSHEILKHKSRTVINGDVGGENNGWYSTSLRLLENHIPEASQSSMKQSVEDELPSIEGAKGTDLGKAIGCVLLKNIDVRWRMLSGSDWPDSKATGQRPVEFSGRDATVCLEVALSGMEIQYDVFPVGGIGVSKLSLSVQDFYLYDRSKDAPWKLVLGYYHSKNRPRKSSSKAFKLDLESVRPDPSTPLEEYRLRVALHPMLLHLHQCQLDFLIGFFGAKSSAVEQSSGCHQDSDGPKVLPVNSNNLARTTIDEEAFLPYFQKFDIWPILVRVDYCPSRVDLTALRGGKFVELVNLVPWKGVELQLKHVHAVGIYGWGSVCETTIGEWLEEISQNQVHKILRGLPTIRSLVAVGAGAAKLVSLPIESYRKDKRLLKGMQRGTIAFLRSISLEAVGLGVHLAGGAHDILLQAEYLLTGIPSSAPWSVPHKMKTNVRSNQPKDAQQGIHQAYESLSDGLGKSASALVRTPLKKYQRGAGAGSALVTAVRGVPAAAIAPASACASAVHCALLGFRNSLDPERKKESMEKYLGPPQPWEQN